MNYAILRKDGSGIVKGVSCLEGKVNRSDMIEIPDFDESLIGKKWDGKKFIDSGIIPPVRVDPLVDIQAKLNKLDLDLAEVKADVKGIKNKP
uniref:Uncharacterized protein n=1 Tax=viral metagenome TaxID=1070528 RepID=A0A6H1Z734_9ZZZZ